MVKNLPVNAGALEDMGSILGLGRFPRGGNGNVLQYSCWDNSMDRKAWWAIVHRVSGESETREHTHTRYIVGLCCICFIYSRLYLLTPNS